MAWLGTEASGGMGLGIQLDQESLMASAGQAASKISTMSIGELLSGFKGGSRERQNREAGGLSGLARGEHPSHR